ncbi:hypothetical protein Tco_0479244 [Tanacetum coccineum]
MSIQDRELQKQQYLEEMQRIINQIQIKDYHNERIDIHYRRECEIKVANLSTHTPEPSRCFNFTCYDDDYDDEERTIPLSEIISRLPPSIPPILLIKDPEDSLSMGNEELSTIPEKESDKLIKSSVEDYVPNPSKSEDTSRSDSECDLPLCDDFSPINIPKGKSMIFSNPLFDLNDNFTCSDDESLSDEDVLKNKDECFDPGSDVDEIELLLHRDPSTPKISVASIHEGFTDEPPLEENDDSKIQYLNDNQARFAA